MSKVKLGLCSVLFVLMLAAPASASDPWTPEEGELTIYASTVFETFDEFWAGNSKTVLLDATGEDEINQYTWGVGTSYGLLESLSIDISIGYTTVEGGVLGDEGGINDSSIGARWRFLDEFESEQWFMPSIALMSNLIIAGTYDDGAFPVSPGDGANGVEVGALFGKVFGETGFGAFGGVGYRLRENPVPDDLLLNAGLFGTFFEGLTVSAEYKREQALSGMDISAANFSPEKSRELKEISDDLEFSVGYTHDTGWYIGLLYGLTVDGRNTGKQDTFAATVVLPIFPVF